MPDRNLLDSPIFSRASRSSAPARSTPRREGKRARKGCAPDRAGSRLPPRFTSFEMQQDDLGDADLGTHGQSFLDAARQALAVHPGAVRAVVDDQKAPARRIAAYPQMLARNLIIGVESNVDRGVVSPAADHDLLLSHQKKLWAGVVLIADLGMDAIWRLARFRARHQSRPGYRSHRRLATEKRRLGAVIARLRRLVQLRMDFHVARRNDILRVREKRKNPILTCDLVG